MKPRVLEHLRRRERDLPKNGDTPEDLAEDQHNKVDDSGYRNIDVALLSPRNVAQTLSRSTIKEEEHQDSQDNHFNPLATKTFEATHLNKLGQF